MTSVDGTSIGFEVGGDGPPLLLVHGSSGTRARWAPVAARLAARYTVYVLDRRGRGLSIEEAGPYGLEREAQDVAAVAEAAGSNVYVVGHSFGALTVMEAAMRVATFGRIVLYEPPMPSRQGSVVTPEALATINATTDPRIIMETFYEQTLHLGDAALAAVMATEYDTVAPSAAHTIGRELEAVDQYRATARLLAIAAPVRMLLGSENPTYLQATTAAVASRFNGATIVALEGQAHQCIDDDPEQFIRAVLDFDR